MSNRSECLHERFEMGRPTITVRPQPTWGKKVSWDETSFSPVDMPEVKQTKDDG